MRLVAALTLLLLAGCTSFEERWASATFDGLSYPALFGQVVTTIETEGFGISNTDAQTAKVDSDWVYGTSMREVRGPSRRRAHAVIEPLAAERSFRVRIRVEEEVIRKGGMLATNVRESKDWESYEDNYDDADYLVAKLAAQLEVHRSRKTTP
jgi:uncharacterized lipoprotein